MGTYIISSNHFQMVSHFFGMRLIRGQEQEQEATRSFNLYIAFLLSFDLDTMHLCVIIVNF